MVAVACARDGTICSASRDKTVKLWKPALEVSRVEAHTGEVTAAVFSPDKSFFLTASRDGDIKLWSVEENGALKIAIKVEIIYEYWHHGKLKGDFNSGIFFVYLSQSRYRIWDIIVSRLRSSSLSHFMGIRV